MVSLENASAFPGYTVADNTLLAALPMASATVEVGDVKQPDFKPQVKFLFFDNEVNFSVRAEEDPSATVASDGKVIRYITPNLEVRQYDKPEASAEGGFEFEWVLPSRPKSNSLTATLQSKGLTFYYQPALTEQEIADGAYRPDNVIGSYAVYLSDSKKNVNGGHAYKAGKVAHIFRPIATDALGKTSWADLNIVQNNGVGHVTVTVPDDFLASATYPVVVDPTFGYTTIGGSTTLTFRQITSARITATVAGTLTSISVYESWQAASGNGAAALYANSSGAPGSFIASSSTTAVPSSAAWTSFTISSSLSASTDYYLAAWGTDNGSSNVTYYYDSGASGDGYNVFNNSPFSWPNPQSSPTNNSRKYSIYATYTAAASGSLFRPSMLSGLGSGGAFFQNPLG